MAKVRLQAMVDSDIAETISKMAEDADRSISQMTALIIKDYLKMRQNENK